MMLAIEMRSEANETTHAASVIVSCTLGRARSCCAVHEPLSSGNISHGWTARPVSRSETRKAAEKTSCGSPTVNE